MSRNANSRFAVNPTNIDIQRSRFNRPHDVKTTFNAGQLIPFYVDADVLPGDTYQVDTSKVVRMQTPLTPFMDNLYLDTYWFFVPHRLVWKHWKQFMGENTDSAWLPEVEYTVPQISAPPDYGWDTGTIADYFGIPVGFGGFSVNALPFRAYALVCNEWFRSTPLTDPLVIPDGDETQQGARAESGLDPDAYITDVANGGTPFKVAKFHDYFTSALPSPQRGPDVEIPVANLGNLPVVPLNENVPLSSFPMMNNPDATSSFHTMPYPTRVMDPSGNTDVHGNLTYDRVNYGSEGAYYRAVNLNASGGGSTLNVPSATFANLWALQDSSVAAATINQLRTAFQIQRYYERLARGGDRYIEMIKSFFNVTSPDARLQRPEYLGGNRVPIHVNQVIQTNDGAYSGIPLGTTGAMSLTTDSHSDFTHSFVEHGTLLGLMCVRYDHTYQQGLARQFSRKTRFDFYFPVFAHLGEQAIKNKEIFLQSDSVVGETGVPVNDEVFGFQERWAEYRYRPSICTGQMRSTDTMGTPLDTWHLADHYSELPRLSDGWIREDPNNVDRVLAVSGTVAHQFFADIFVKEKVTRPMPMYSIPGLIDHY